MTKLLEWLSFATVAIGIWSAIVFQYVKTPTLDRWMYLIIPSPVIFLALFGLYAITVILYRVFTFNDCEYAEKELQEQIIEAKKDLKSRGYEF